MRISFLILIAFCLARPSPGAAQGVVFDQRYKAGHRYHQTVTTEQEMDMDLGTQKVEQRMTMTLGLMALADDAANGGKRVIIAYDRAAMSQSAAGKKYSYDSKEPDTANAGPLAVLGGIVGKEFTVLFDAAGGVVEVENFDATIKRLAAGNPATAQLYTQLFSKDAVKRMMQESALRSPGGRAMKPEETWPLSHEMQLPSIGRLVVRGNYTFKGMKEHEGQQLAEVKAEAQIHMEVVPNEDKNTPNLVNQMKMKVEEGRMEGTLLYDPAIKFTRAAQIVQNITLTATIPDGERRTLRLPMKQRIHMVLDEFAPIEGYKPKAEEKKDESK